MSLEAGEGASSILAVKAALRAELRARRKALSAAARSAAAEALVAACADLPSVGLVAGYVAIGSEIDPLPLMRALVARGAALALPVPAAKATPMAFRLWPLDSALQTGPLCPLPPPGEVVQPDLLLVPLLGYDRFGGRLGQGGGYYDATLAALRQAGWGGRAIGLAFSVQECKMIPRETTDAVLDAILTECGLIELKD